MPVPKGGIYLNGVGFKMAAHYNTNTNPNTDLNIGRNLET